MNKGLEALIRIEDLLNRLYETDVINDDHTHDINIIEKALKRLEELEEEKQSFDRAIEKKLKALEIIKEKIKIDFNDHYFGFEGNYYIIVNHDVFGAIKVDKEQFELLKEVLNDDN